MDDLLKRRSDPEPDARRKRMVNAAIGFVFGAMFGLMWGAVLGSQAMGLIIGAGFGLMIAAAWDRRYRKQ